MISIIVPVYNTEKYLHRCVDSILEQTYTDFELLLINDGSTDSSGAICDEYAMRDSRVRVFHKENGGVSSARNLGLDNANGEWIAFVDSDDYVFPIWLENYEELYKKYSTDLICQGFQTDRPLNVTLKDTTYGISNIGTTIDVIEKLLHNNILGFCWNKLFQSNIINTNKLRFRENVSLKEDEIFAIEYMKYSTTCICTDKVGYYYHVPEWQDKYNIASEQCEIICQTLYSLATDIFSDKSNEVYVYYRRQLIDFYFQQCIYSKSNKFKYIKGLREFIKKDFLTVPISWFTKSVILVDSTMCISSLIILLHAGIKKRFKYEK